MTLLGKKIITEIYFTHHIHSVQNQGFWLTTRVHIIRTYLSKFEYNSFKVLPGGRVLQYLL